MISYLIIDDEPIAHDIIKRYCDLLPNMTLMKNCYDALDALAYLNKQEVDLIFLDLNMPKLKGFEFLRTLASPPKVIVTTAYQEYAIEGYELNIADYLLKPFGFERFLKAINKALSHPTKATPDSIGDRSILPNRIFIRSNKKYTQVVLDTILYLEAAGNYTKVITTTETIVTREKISELLVSLGSDDFLQVHKSFAVAKKHIKNVEGNRIAIADQFIPIGKIYKMKVDQLISPR